VVENERVETPWGGVGVRGARDGAAQVVLRPGAVRLAAAGAGDGVRGTVRRCTFAGDHLAVSVDVPGAPLVVARAPLGSPFEPGDTVCVSIDPDGVLVYGA
jgi:ABC-type Fe3+/spermidine/putrescine transport system ATPase subunit